MPEAKEKDRVPEFVRLRRIRRAGLGPVGRCIVVLALAGLRPGATADEPDSTPASDSALYSTTRRFLAVGPDPALGLQSLLFAEETARRMEREMGQALPAQQGNPLRMLFAVDENMAESMIVPRRTRIGARIVQRILVVNPDRADPEAFLEALAAELLDRYIWARRAPGGDVHPVTGAPDWIATGLAQELYPASRARNYTVLRRMAVQGELFSFARAISPDAYGEHGALARAVHGAVFAWLQSRSLFDNLVEEWARNGEPGHSQPLSEWLMETGAFPSLADMDMEWNLWLASQHHVLRALGHADTADLLELEQRLQVPARSVPGAPHAEIRWVTPEKVIRHRGEDWAREGARRLRLGLMRLKNPVRGADYYEVVRAFTSLMSDIETSAARRRWNTRAVEEELLSRLHRAQEQRDALTTILREPSPTEQNPSQAGYRGRPVPNAAHQDLQRRLDTLHREYPEADDEKEPPPRQP